MKSNLFAISILLLSVCTLETVQQNSVCSGCIKLSSESDKISHTKLAEILTCRDQSMATQFSEYILQSCPHPSHSEEPSSDGAYCARFQYTATKPTNPTISYEIFYRLCFSKTVGLTQGCFTHLRNWESKPGQREFVHISSDDTELVELMPNMKLRVKVCDSDACGKDYDRKYSGGNSTVVCPDSSGSIPPETGIPSTDTTPSSESSHSEHPSPRTPGSPVNPRSSDSRKSGMSRIESFIVWIIVVPALVLVKSF